VIREKDGIHFKREKHVVADARSTTGDINIVSHAHMDHGFQDSGEVVCSGRTAKILSRRTGKEVKPSQDPDVELIPSGHIVGSRSALFGEEERILYTGDVSLQDRVYMDGFEPVEADVLVVESTYGIPAYRLPDMEEVEKQITDWIHDTSSQPFLFGYSLGKAQKVQKIVEDATEKPILAHGAVKKMNDVVEEVTGLEFRAKPYSENKELLEEGAIFIGPTRTAKEDWLNEKVEKLGGVKAGFSGWGVQDSYRYRGGYDQVFPLSDHCGFDDLVKLVKQVDPEKVYTHHGFDEAFASHLKNEHGYNARSLKKNQSSLADF
jgi:putative mRNA 3-end processing factor